MGGVLTKRDDTQRNCGNPGNSGNSRHFATLLLCPFAIYFLNSRQH